MTQERVGTNSLDIYHDDFMVSLSEVPWFEDEGSYDMSNIQKAGCCTFRDRSSSPLTLDILIGFGNAAKTSFHDSPTKCLSPSARDTPQYVMDCSQKLTNLDQFTNRVIINNDVLSDTSSSSPNFFTSASSMHYPSTMSLSQSSFISSSDIDQVSALSQEEDVTNGERSVDSNFDTLNGISLSDALKEDIVPQSGIVNLDGLSDIHDTPPKNQCEVRIKRLSEDMCIKYLKRHENVTAIQLSSREDSITKEGDFSDLSPHRDKSRSVKNSSAGDLPLSADPCISSSDIDQVSALSQEEDVTNGERSVDSNFDTLNGISLSDALKEEIVPQSGIVNLDGLSDIHYTPPNNHYEVKIKRLSEDMCIKCLKRFENMTAIQLSSIEDSNTKEGDFSDLSPHRDGSRSVWNSSAEDLPLSATACSLNLPLDKYSPLDDKAQKKFDIIDKCLLTSLVPVIKQFSKKGEELSKNMQVSNHCERLSKKCLFSLNRAKKAVKCNVPKNTRGGKKKNHNVYIRVIPRKCKDIFEIKVGNVSSNDMVVPLAVCQMANRKRRNTPQCELSIPHKIKSSRLSCLDPHETVLLPNSNQTTQSPNTFLEELVQIPSRGLMHSTLPSNPGSHQRLPSPNSIPQQATIPNSFSQGFVPTSSPCLNISIETQDTLTPDFIETQPFTPVLTDSF